MNKEISLLKIELRRELNNIDYISEGIYSSVELASSIDRLKLLCEYEDGDGWVNCDGWIPDVPHKDKILTRHRSGFTTTVALPYNFFNWAGDGTFNKIVAYKIVR